MDPETRAALDATWFEDADFWGGFWMRVVSCGDRFRVRQGGWQGRTQGYEGIWEVQQSTENQVEFFNQ